MLAHMTLVAGTKLGPYEIIAPAGKGGMGEVYRARDTRLERTVAIKVLPEHLSSSPALKRRFEVEAKAISQFSHSHICALYDVGTQAGTDYLVMEYLEGETLEDRLMKGPLVLNQALEYAIHIADALDKAHRHAGRPSRSEAGECHVDEGRCEADGFLLATGADDGATEGWTRNARVGV